MRVGPGCASGKNLWRGMSYISEIRLQAVDDAQENRSWYGEPASAPRIYAYVNNDPLNNVDPSGKCPWCVGAIIGAGGNILALYLTEGGNATWQQYAEAGAIGAIAGASFNVEAVAANIAGAIARTGASEALSAAGADVVAGAVNGGVSNVANQLISPTSNGFSVGDAVLATAVGGVGAGLLGTSSALETGGGPALPNTVNQLVGQVGASLTDTINTEVNSPNGLPPGPFPSTASTTANK